MLEYSCIWPEWIYKIFSFTSISTGKLTSLKIIYSTSQRTVNRIDYIGQTVMSHWIDCVHCWSIRLRVNLCDRSFPERNLHVCSLCMVWTLKVSGDYHTHISSTAQLCWCLLIRVNMITLNCIFCLKESVRHVHPGIIYALLLDGGGRR